MVLVVSNDFVEGDWCCLEVRGGLTENMKRKSNYVIAIKLEELNRARMTPELRQFMHHNIYLEAGDHDFWPKLKCFLPPPSGNEDDVGGNRWEDFLSDEERLMRMEFRQMMELEHM
jgi:hypothetical protein